MSWCFQCGVASRPSKAVGVDEDGEPACSGHQVKEIGAGLNAAAASRTAVPTPRSSTKAPGLTAAGVSEVTRATARDTGDRQIPAAPSPVQIKQEKVMDEKFCIVEGCGKKLRSDNNSGYCKPHRNEVKKASGVRKSPKKRPQGLTPEEVLPLALAETGAAGGCSQSAERVITLQLGESKVQKLLDLLLQ